MSSWRVAQHYGFGAARIPIHPEPHHATRLTLVEGLGDLRSEFVDGGPAAMLRRVVGQSPIIALCLLLIIAFFNTVVLRDYSDSSEIQIVLFDTAEPPLLPISEVIPEPEPEPIPVAMETPAPPEKLIPAPPPIEVLAERPKPPPVAKPKPRAKPRAPEMPRLARVEKRPLPVVRPNRAPRLRSAPTAKPRVALDAVAVNVEPSHSSAPKRIERIANVTRAVPSIAPRLDAPAAPRFEMASEAPPPRGFRVAAAVNVSHVRTPNVMPRLAPSPRARAKPVPVAPRRVRTDAPRSQNRPVRISPSLAAAPVSGLASAGPTPFVHRREDRSAPPQRTRHTPRPTAEMASVPAGSGPVLPAASSTLRIARAEAPRAPQGTSESRPGLAGVPLGELAVCLTDRDEDRLKQAVLAAVTTQKECVSGAGIYRFVETKNLNSFLMWIDRASDRAIGDRCDELRNALECLEGASRRAAR